MPKGTACCSRSARYSPMSVRSRSKDSVGRLGGDEFGIILEQCSLRQAIQIGQGICDRVEKFCFVHDGKRFSIGTSVGVLCMDSSWTSTADVLHAVDMACYAAQERGPEPFASLERNRVRASRTTSAVDAAAPALSQMSASDCSHCRRVSSWKAPCHEPLQGRSPSCSSSAVIQGRQPPQSRRRLIVFLDRSGLGAKQPCVVDRDIVGRTSQSERPRAGRRRPVAERGFRSRGT